MKWLLILFFAAVLGAGVFFRQELSQAIATSGGSGGFGVVRSLDGLGAAISKGFQRGFGAFQ